MGAAFLRRAKKEMASDGAGRGPAQPMRPGRKSLPILRAHSLLPGQPPALRILRFGAPRSGNWLKYRE
jgi:hypothetical protein